MTWTPEEWEKIDAAASRWAAGRVRLNGETIGERTNAPSDDMSALFEWCWSRVREAVQMSDYVRYVSISHWGQFPFVKWDEYNQRWVWLPFLVEE